MAGETPPRGGAPRGVRTRGGLPRRDDQDDEGGPAPVTPAPVPPQDVEEGRLLERWLKRGELTAREELVRRLISRARRIARRYEGMGESLDDLVQVASIGLMKAVDRYDLERGASLRTYAERMGDGG